MAITASVTGITTRQFTCLRVALSRARRREQLRLGGRVRARVPRLPLRLLRGGLPRAGYGRGGEARPDPGQRPRRGGDGRPRRAHGRRADRGAAELARDVPDAPLEAGLAERRRVARV